MLLRERSGCLAESRPGLGGGGETSEWLLGAGFAEGRNCSGAAGFTLYSYSVIATLLGSSKYVLCLLLGGQSGYLNDQPSGSRLFRLPFSPS